MRLILLLLAATLAGAISAGAEPTEYDDFVSRFGSSGENIRIDKLTHAHWIIDFHERCMLRRMTTTYVSRDGQLGLVDNTIEAADIGTLMEESFIRGEGASRTQVKARCVESTSCVSGVRAETGRDGSRLTGPPTARKTLANHMVLQLGSVAYKHRLELLKQIATICRSSLGERK